MSKLKVWWDNLSWQWQAVVAFIVLALVGSGIARLL